MINLKTSILMKMHTLSSFVLISACASLSAHATFVDDFDNLNNWDIYNAGDGSLAPVVVSDSGENYMQMQFAASAVSPAVTRTDRIITKSAYADLNFVTSSEPVSLVFENLSMQVTGATGTLAIGLTPDNTNGNIYTRTNAIFFAQSGTGSAQLTLRDGAVNTTLWSTSNSADLSMDYSMMSLVLTSTTWAFELYDAGGSNLVSVSGSMTVNAANWQNDLYLSLALQQSSTNSATSTLTLNGINTIPEPATAALWMAVSVALALFVRVRRARRA
jgi:hypothetical protein